MRGRSKITRKNATEAPARVPHAVLRTNARGLASLSLATRRLVSMASIVRLTLFSLLLLVFLAASALAHSHKQQAVMPQPFTRQLSLQTPLMNGSDVLILQWLVNRSPFVQGNITKDGNFGTETAGAVKAFQAGNNMYVVPRHID